MMFLQTYGVTDALCLRLVRKYGNEAKSILENDPTASSGSQRHRFKTADRIALTLACQTMAQKESRPECFT